MKNGSSSVTGTFLAINLVLLEFNRFLWWWFASELDSTLVSILTPFTCRSTRDKNRLMYFILVLVLSFLGSNSSSGYFLHIFGSLIILSCNSYLALSSSSYKIAFWLYDLASLIFSLDILFGESFLFLVAFLAKPDHTTLCSSFILVTFFSKNLLTIFWDWSKRNQTLNLDK